MYIMETQPEIKVLPETKLIGKKVRMSFAQNKTMDLWKSFMPVRSTISHSVSPDLYSVEIYHDPTFFTPFDPTKTFEKWAAIQVDRFTAIPENMDKLVVPEGWYAVFLYKGKASEARAIYQYIFTKWIPDSEYELDDRPHFALMGEKYKGEDPESEEDIWIPIIKK